MFLNDNNNEDKHNTRYLSVFGAWALAFGCSVGWGSFVMPGTTFLPIAGPLGATIGIIAGSLTMFIPAMNFHYLMHRYQDGGGTYTYTKNCFGYDHGFLSAWFLILTYIAIIWANATALPLIARTLLGPAFQFGFDYEVAGFHVYMGEIMLAIGSLVIAALLCLKKQVSQWSQILFALCLFLGVVLCFVVAAALKNPSVDIFKPGFSPNHSAFGGTFTIFALAPWAFVGFESISHSAGELNYSTKHNFPIMAIALVSAGLVYILLILLSVTALPQGASTWVDYILNLDNYSGLQSQPAFFSAHQAFGNAGALILGIAALGAIFTGLIGNFITLSRLLRTMSDDGMFPEFIGKLDKNNVPRNAILIILAISVILPFFGRTAISWIVDVTTVGATIAYAFASASAFSTARKEKKKSVIFTGFLGLIVSVLFALEFLIPNITSVKTLATESYLILATWGILGFIMFLKILKTDRQHRLGRSIVAWVVLFGLIIFTSTVWLRQTTENSIENSIKPIHTYYNDQLTKAGIDVVTHATKSSYEYLHDIMSNIDRSLSRASTIQISLIIIALIILFIIYSKMQKREKQVEVEKVLAEESSRAKTSFLSNMSHEIRTPMNAIIGLDNIALRDPDISPRTREQLEKIGASAKHLLGLINDILDMSRIESGRMVLKDEEFAFREFIDQISIIINGQCLDKGLHYECHMAGHPKDYYIGDDMRLKQVLINILGNSVKFTPSPGEVSLTAEHIDTGDDTCILRFTMRDTGIGMDKEYIPKIFEAFSQEDATMTNRYGGSGLGMAITKNFVDMMNGEITVDSEKGVGTVFTVSVPLKKSERTSQANQKTTLPDKLRAIIVDDDEIACEHAQILMRNIGIETDAVTSARNALKLVRESYKSENPYDIILTDYKMPNINGLELTKAVRMFDNHETTIVLLTGYNWNIIEDEAKDGGVDAILAKPLFTEPLLNTLHSLLGHGANDTANDILEPEEENSLSGCRILMAEDVEANAEILADLLELEDMTSERAENGQQAIDMFLEKPAGYYDAILMDVRMPVMDGLSATKGIRALSREDAKTIPIIAMTANVFDEDVENSLNAGMNAHLSKPIEPDRLYETLKTLIFKLS